MSDTGDAPRMTIDFRIGKDRGPARPKVQVCERPGCARPGTHQAPKSKDNTRERVWLCLDHVRALNENWNYFEGMSEAEVQQFQRDAQTGHRPTWKLKDRFSAPWQMRAEKARFSGRTQDTYQVFEDGQATTTRNDTKAGRVKIVGKLQMEALTVMGLTVEASLNDVKRTYKELVKRYHPDVNGGDRSAEERLAQVIRAYGVLKKSNFS
jgi:DnaJ-domain-containing protein 1